MRIDGKRASQFTQEELWLMIHRRTGPNGEILTKEQIAELKKTYSMRKERAFSNG